MPSLGASFPHLMLLLILLSTEHSDFLQRPCASLFPGNLAYQRHVLGRSPVSMSPPPTLPNPTMPHSLYDNQPMHRPNVCPPWLQESAVEMALSLPRVLCFVTRALQLDCSVLSQGAFRKECFSVSGPPGSVITRG